MDKRAIQAKQRGVTMIEACCVLAIAGILVGGALPLFGDQMDRRALDGVSAELHTDLMYARSEAVARNRGVRVSFHAPQGRSCYVVHTGERSDCRCDGEGPAVCENGAVALKTVSGSRGVAVAANVSSLRFDAINGTSTPAGTVCTVAANGRSVHHVVNIMGRVRTCRPAAQAAPCAPC